MVVGVSGMRIWCILRRHPTTVCPTQLRDHLEPTAGEIGAAETAVLGHILFILQYRYIYVCQRIYENLWHTHNCFKEFVMGKNLRVVIYNELLLFQRMQEGGAWLTRLSINVLWAGLHK